LFYESDRNFFKNFEDVINYKNSKFIRTRENNYEYKIFDFEIKNNNNFLFAFNDSEFGDVYSDLGRRYFYFKNSFDGTVFEYYLYMELDAYSRHGLVFPIIWNNGEKNDNFYKNFYSSGDCSNSYIKFGNDLDMLEVTGKTSYGNIYEYKGNSNALESIYKDNYWNSENNSYEDFIKLHPIIFWKNSLGDVVMFYSQDICFGNC